MLQARRLQTVFPPARFGKRRAKEGGVLSTQDAEGDEALPRLQSLPGARRAQLAISAAGFAVFAFVVLGWSSARGLAAIESPWLWLALAAFWFAAYCAAYARAIGVVRRALASAGKLEATGVRVYWMRAPRSGALGAGMEVRARASDERFPMDLSVYVNVNVLWNVQVVGVRAAWTCKESGVLLLSPKRSRFLGGATPESLSLPSQEEAAIRGLLRRTGDDDGTPDWGAPAGAHALRALEEVGAERWLFGPEQPFVVLEATEGQIEKFWSPVASRLVDLDVESALDLLRVVRGFDRDAIASRGTRATSSRGPSHPPSSPRP
jgi:hypothetical protein